jgi:pyruvate dehydrogenase E1 component alpha subunit
MEPTVGNGSVDRWRACTNRWCAFGSPKSASPIWSRAGEIGCPCHLYIGQEAIASGVCEALNEKDYVWGGHRSHGHYLAKGGSLDAMMAEILGKATGCADGRGGSMHLFAPEVGILGTVPLVAATIPLAVGTALASKLRRDGRVSVAVFWRRRH